MGELRQLLRGLEVDIEYNVRDPRDVVLSFGSTPEAVVGRQRITRADYSLHLPSRMWRRRGHVIRGHLSCTKCIHARPNGRAATEGPDRGVKCPFSAWPWTVQGCRHFRDTWDYRDTSLMLCQHCGGITSSLYFLCFRCRDDLPLPLPRHPPFDGGYRANEPPTIKIEDENTLIPPSPEAAYIQDCVSFLDTDLCRRYTHNIQRCRSRGIPDADTTARIQFTQGMIHDLSRLRGNPQQKLLGMLEIYLHARSVQILLPVEESDPRELLRTMITDIPAGIELAPVNIYDRFTIDEAPPGEVTLVE